MSKRQMIIRKGPIDPPSIVVQGCVGCPFSRLHNTGSGLSCELDLMHQRIHINYVSGPETPSWCMLKKTQMIVRMDAKLMNTQPYYI